MTDINSLNIPFEAIYNAAPDAMIIVDGNGKIALVNNQTEALFGYTKQELIGEQIEILIPNRYHRHHHKQREGYTEKPTVRSMGARSELFGSRKDGSEFPVEISLSPILHNNKKWISSAIRDISDKKLISQELNKAKNAAEAANKAKSSFLANMSHELRTPMNAIIGYSEMLIEDAEDEDQIAFIPDLEKIRNAGKHLLELINDVLDLSKIEAGKMDVIFEEVEIKHLLEDIKATITGLIENNGNIFKIDFPKNPVSLVTDFVKLKQALLNLLSNAAKFTKNGEIKLELLAKGDRIIFNIADTGIGIPEDKVDSLFDEFTQADETTTREFGGTGLGLAITKRFCNLLKGELYVKSVFGKGSTFTIDLPIEGAPVVKEKKEIVLSTPIAKSDVRPVLVIEDDPVASSLIERILTKEGYRVIKAANGVEGIKLAKEHDPFVITLDVMMPEKDGWSVLTEMKENKVLKEIPVIIISVLDNLDIGYALGAKGYFTKPVQKEQLLNTIESCIPTQAISTGHVLIVDDEKDARDILSKMLTKRGWKSETAKNGKEALDHVREHKPSLILLDLMMPVMDGFTFMKNIRKDEELRKIPVVVVTARDLSVKEAKELNQSVKEIVHKGAYDFDELNSQLIQLVNNVKIKN